MSAITSAVVITIPPAVNPYARISEVAARLGVAPHQSGVAAVLMTGADGKNYDVFEVIIAFLDRMEKT